MTTAKRLSVDSIERAVRQYFRDNGASFGLDADSLSVAYTLNWGGFVNHSFRVADGEKQYHLKLSTTAEGCAALARWKELSTQLERYHAPPVLAWIDTGPAAGLLFPFCAGDTPELGPDVIDQVLPVLRRVNSDQALSAYLRAARAVTPRAAYLATLHDRFTEDLRYISARPPHFLAAGMLQWLHDEVARLDELVLTTAVFQEPLGCAVHGDVWLNNVLWTNSADWYLLDWDDMRIGDPALDIATLIGPSAQDLQPLKMVDHVAGRLSDSERARLPLLGRATLLDWIIDPVADWLDADVAPGRMAEVRSEKERVHSVASALYGQLYDAPAAVRSHSRFR